MKNSEYEILGTEIVSIPSGHVHVEFAIDKYFHVYYRYKSSTYRRLHSENTHPYVWNLVKDDEWSKIPPKIKISILKITRNNRINGIIR